MRRHHSVRTILRAILERSDLLATSYRELREMFRYYRSRLQKTPHGFLFSGNPSMEAGAYEILETQVVKALLCHVDVVINIGANIGYYTCLARAHQKRVVAFEPIRANLRFLLRNLRANGWCDVEVFPVALGDHSGISEMYGGGTGASLLKGWAGTSERFVTLVPMNSLDNILGNRFYGQRLLIIIDVEGAELAVINGAKNHLAMGPKPIWMVEIAMTEHLPAGLAVNPNLLATFQAFWRKGYVALRLDSTLGTVSEEEIAAIQQGGQSEFGNNNFLFVDESKCKEIRSICINALDRQ